jgi:phospholipid/cholesterol/gamma-HCH transport system substrate-binding protein
MGKFSLETKVGLFFLGCLGTAAYVLFSILGVRTGNGFELSALFRSVAGLPEGAQVQIAGIKVGNVKEIRLDMPTGKALVVMRIKSEYLNSIPVGSTAGLRSKGLLGDKYVVIIPGKPNAKRLKPGDRITEVAEPEDADRIIETYGIAGENIKAITDSIRKQLIDRQGIRKLSGILSNSDEFFKEMRGLVSANRGRLNRTIERMEKFSENINKTGDRLAKIAEEWDEMTSDVRDGRGTLGALISDDTLNREALALVRELRGVADRIQYGPGAMSRLINDPELYYEARRAIRNMNKTAEDVSEATPVSTLAIILGSVFR